MNDGDSAMTEVTMKLQ